MRAFKLYTGKDNASHVLEGTLTLDRRADVKDVHFKESPPHSSFDWHDAPEPQYVITLAGTLEFTTQMVKVSSYDRATFWWRPTMSAAATSGA